MPDIKPTKPSNVERRAWKTKCRELLAEYIKKHTGLSVPAADIRLVTSEREPYLWKYLPEAEHLFSKNLSDHSIGAYRQLYAGIGQTFEAVSTALTNPISASQGERIAFGSVDGISFSSHIAELTRERENLKSEIRTAHERLEAETVLRDALESDLKVISQRCESLEKLLEESQKRADVSEQTATYYARGINKMYLVLEEMGSSAVVPLGKETGKVV